MVSKREKRLARQLKDREDFERKKARQAIEPAVSKVVRQAVKPGGELMTWTQDTADIVGEWSWGPRSCMSEDWEETILPFLTEYEKKTWNEITTEKTGSGKKRRKKHIAYPVADICREAQDRLVEIERDDVDQLFAFGLVAESACSGQELGRYSQCCGGILRIRSIQSAKTNLVQHAANSLSSTD